MRLLRAARGNGNAIPVSPRGRAMAARVPVYPSGTALEVAELAWISEGVSRELAMSIAAVQMCRDLIVGTVIQLGLLRYRDTERLDPDYLLAKPDPSTTLPATIAGTVDDLLFHGRSYWRVLDRDSEGFARRARWTPFMDVTPQTRASSGSYSELTGYRIDGIVDVVAVEDVIRFDGALPGVLLYGGRVLSAALELEAAARRLASVELPAGVLKNDGGEIGTEEAKGIVADFQASRRENGIAFLQGVTYSRENISPADLQLLEARYNIATEVARLFNMPVSMIGASPSGTSTALLYANLSQTLTFMTTTAVAPHLRVIEATLSDVIPRGQSVAFDVQSYLRADPQAAADYAIALAGANLVTVEEARSMLGIPATETSADLTPGRI